MPPLVEYHVMDKVTGDDVSVRLNQQTLTDGSYVYDVCFYNEHDVEIFALHPVDLCRAKMLFSTIRNAIVCRK